MTDKRMQDRARRSKETPIVGGLPDFPGILAAMNISSNLAQPLRALADFLLFSQWDGVSIDRAEREIIATSVSAANDCIYCMDSHGAFSRALLLQNGVDEHAAVELMNDVKSGQYAELSQKMQSLIEIALCVQRRALDLTAEKVEAAKKQGATDQDVQLSVLIAAAFCMYNRIVDGFRAQTPGTAEAYEARSYQIAEFGYQDQRLVAVPIVKSLG